MPGPGGRRLATVRITATAITATLKEATLPVDPGQSVATELHLRNDGPDGVEVRLAVTGPGRPYSWVTPDTVWLGPGAEVVARVGFHMPRAPVPAAGPVPFEVTATPTGHDGAAAAAGGVVDLRRFNVLSATLSHPPDRATTRRGARHELTVGNRGNAPAPTQLRAELDGGDLDVRIEPDHVVVAPGNSTTATVEVAATRRAFTGRRRTLAFRVVAEPQAGSPVEVEGQFHPEPVVSGRGALIVAIAAAVSVVAGLVAVTSNDGPGERTDNPVAAAGARLDACPARGHTDDYGIRSLKPEEIDKLPNAYTFLAVKSDGCSPVRFNPCEPVHYVQNAAAAPPTVVADVQEAFRRLSRATGITFVDEGFTDETSRRGPYVPERYGSRWAPILVLWEHFPAEQTTGEAQVLGQTIVMREQDVVVSARLRFNVDAYNDEATRTPIRDGFGPPVGSGAGPIGRNNISWGRIILHELAHVAGLGHTRDQASLMYPDAAQQTSRPADFTPPDLLGLRYLGAEAGCLPSPPLPAG